MDAEQTAKCWNELYEAGADRTTAVEAFEALQPDLRVECWTKLHEPRPYDLERVKAVHSDLIKPILAAFNICTK